MRWSLSPAGFEVLKPHLNERQRRPWLGAEARELGSGEATVVARAAGVAGDTIRRGRAELERRALPVEHRMAGAYKWLAWTMAGRVWPSASTPR